MNEPRKKIAVLTGAGISAESGLRTFRDAGGLWENYSIEEVATPMAWQRNPQLVLDFYNQRRRDVLRAQPNEGHHALVRLEQAFDVTIITQNIDDLHERAGSSKVMHLHGEILKVRSTQDERLLYPWTTDVHLGDCCELGSQLRPHVVWFYEPVPMME
ncbi:MAG: NAD-dependent deacylase, partial [Chitinophagales bacterium]|nr:NAD-dependent deacylase [Chitinophagales bacterium]